MKTYGVVSDNFDGDTVHVRKDNFISSQHTQLNYHERASLPNPDQVSCSRNSYGNKQGCTEDVLPFNPGYLASARGWFNRDGHRRSG